MTDIQSICATVAFIAFLWIVFSKGFEVGSKYEREQMAKHSEGEGLVKHEEERNYQ